MSKYSLATKSKFSIKAIIENLMKMTISNKLEKV